jgi:RNA polymerase sigma-70 factor (ECF subfamily)
MLQGFATSGVLVMAETPSESVTRPSLLFRLRDPQDGAAWGTFVDTYGPIVFGHCRRRGLRHEDAQDVTQRVFGRVAQAMRSFEYNAEVGRFRDWLGTVVRNEVNRFLKAERDAEQGRGGSDVLAILENVEARCEDSAWDAEFQAGILQAALARGRPHFEPDTWRAFELVWLENKPAEDVARSLGRTIDWVYVAKSRVLKHLWQEVQDLAEDASCGARF